ncbi:thioether cross-link-forming SCIFF peptide maturase [Isachenkonia alkalipeptolytica]|uniref:Thioether cross-link-forming SCIFF peptide maturase n=1 Tax=Isachenkonia alkalipeptolytica TaxID=2565777 RepID=A0AA44BEE9_9CLOT|nr:thioether cross-link-forming SCIFF peptide maturase [Isachenkonia alkalipeptolytica]NBG88917.1 thioether cross-link-forming SCIFF peptide maturase [Isachenkonia alkalipeptolytica]
MIYQFEKDNIPVVLDVNSGAVHIVDRMVYDILALYPNDEEKPKVPRERVLLKLQHKYPKEHLTAALDELDLLINEEQLFSKIIKRGEKFEHVIKALCLHIAHDCNIRCEYCFASQGNFKGENLLMDFDTGAKALDFLIENSENRQNLEVDFFGGEPLLNFQVVKKLVDYGKEKAKVWNKNMRFTITTNGTLLNEENMDYINENMENIVLSIDGNKKTNDRMRYTVNNTGTYDLILPKIKKMVEKRGNKPYYVRGTFTKFNKDFAKDVIHLAEQGFRNVSVEPVVAPKEEDYALGVEDLPEIKEQYDILEKAYFAKKGTKEAFEFFHFKMNLQNNPCQEKRALGCGAGVEYVSVTPEGEIYPCHQFAGNEKFKMGSIWNQEKLDAKIVTSFKSASVDNKIACRDCWAKYYCSGGCHANAYHENRSLFNPYELGCEMEKKRIQNSIIIEAKKRLGRDGS